MHKHLTETTERPTGWAGSATPAGSPNGEQDKLLMQDLDITQTILGCCFDVMNELGIGFLESVYKNSLIIALREKGLHVEAEVGIEVSFRGEKVGQFFADLVVENRIILELKCCEALVGEHQAQLINYLKASHSQVGLLVNFGTRKVEYKRLSNPHYSEA